MALTRIRNNQVYNSDINAAVKIQLGSITGNLFANTLSYSGNLIVSGVTTHSANVVISNSTASPLASSTVGSLVISGAGGLAVGGNINAQGSLYSAAATSYFGAGSSSSNLTNPIIIAKGAGSTYTQVALINTTATGSADFIAYPDNYPGSSNDHGWSDLGFTGSAFNDPNYTITKPNDAYVFGSAASNSYGGNLVLATDSTGSYNDIVFATGGFASANEKMRFINSTGQLYIETTTSSTSTATGALRVAGGAGIAGSVYANNFTGVSVYAGTIGNTGASLVGTLTGSATSATYVTGLTSANVQAVIGSVTSASFPTLNQNTTGTATSATYVTGLTAANVQSVIGSVSSVSFPTLNQNTTGSAQYVTGLTAANVQAVIGSVSSASFPTLNQNTTGTAATVTTANQPNITTVSGLTSFGTAGVTTTAQGNLTVVGNLTVSGNINTIGNVYNTTIVGNTGQFFGNISGFNALYAGIGTGYFIEPQMAVQISTNFNGYAGVNMQNINSGPLASTDMFWTPNNGTANDTFLDVGISSSTYSYPGYSIIQPNDAYIIAYGNATTQGGNLILNTGISNDIIFATNGSAAANEVMRITRANVVNIKSTVSSTTTTNGALVVAGGAGIAGNLFVGNIITTGGVFWANGNSYSSGVSGGSTYSNANVAAYLPTYTGNLTAGNINVTNQIIGYYTGVIGANIANTGSFTTLTANSLTTNGTSGNISGANYIFSNVVNAGTIGNINALLVGNLSGSANSATYITGLTAANVQAVIGSVSSASFPTLNQNTTGSAQFVTGLTAANVQAVIGSVTSASFPTLNQNTTGYAATVSGAAQGNITSFGNLTGLSVNGVTNLYGGAGGTQLAMWSGGDLLIYNATNTGSTRLYCDNDQQLLISGTILPSANITYNLGSTTANWSTVYAVTFSGTSTTAKYADLAEKYIADCDLLPGDVVVFGGLHEITKTTVSHDDRIAGVVSTNPAYLMNSDAAGYPIGLQGRLPCRVLGPINKGQSLVSSSIAGVAQALDKTKYIPGCIIGKSLEEITTDDIQTIEVVVGRL